MVDHKSWHEKNEKKKKQDQILPASNITDLIF